MWYLSLSVRLKGSLLLLYTLLLFGCWDIFSSLRPHRTAAHQDPLSFTISWSLLKFMSIGSVMLSITISFSVSPFSSCVQYFPASESFPMSWLFTSGGQSIGDSASASVLPVNIQCWFPLWLPGLISLQSNALSRVFSSTTVQKHLQRLVFFMVRLSDLYKTTEKTIALLCELLPAKWCLCFLICCLGLPWLSFQRANVF